MGANVGRNRWLDTLRGIAIGQVVIWHLFAPGIAKHMPMLGRAISLTWSGVDLFFVLSGFLIGGILLRNRGAGNYYSVFYARRMLRILPLYALTLVVFVVAFGGDFRWYYLAFGQNVAWATADSYGPLSTAMTWSLAVEEQFYFCLPLMVALTPPRLLLRIIVGLIIVAPVFRAVCHAFGHPHAAYLLLPGRMDALFVGVFIAWMAQKGRLAELRRVAAIALWPLTALLAAFALSNASELGLLMGTIGYTIIALFYGCVLAIIATESRPLPSVGVPIAWMGLGAYSLYLFHTMINQVALALFGANPYSLIASMLCAGAIAVVCWKLIEQPTIEWGHRRFRYRWPEVQSSPMPVAASVNSPSRQAQ